MAKAFGVTPQHIQRALKKLLDKRYIYPTAKKVGYFAVPLDDQGNPKPIDMEDYIRRCKWWEGIYARRAWTKAHRPKITKLNTPKPRRSVPTHLHEGSLRHNIFMTVSDGKPFDHYIYAEKYGITSQRVRKLLGELKNSGVIYPKKQYRVGKHIYYSWGICSKNVRILKKGGQCLFFDRQLASQVHQDPSKCVTAPPRTPPKGFSYTVSASLIEERSTYSQSFINFKEYEELLKYTPPTFRQSFSQTSEYTFWGRRQCDEFGSNIQYNDWNDLKHNDFCLKVGNICETSKGVIETKVNDQNQRALSTFASMASVFSAQEEKEKTISRDSNKEEIVNTKAAFPECKEYISSSTSELNTDNSLTPNNSPNSNDTLVETKVSLLSAKYNERFQMIRGLPPRSQNVHSIEQYVDKSFNIRELEARKLSRAVAFLQEHLEHLSESAHDFMKGILCDVELPLALNYSMLWVLSGSQWPLNDYVADSTLKFYRGSQREVGEIMEALWSVSKNVQRQQYDNNLIENYWDMPAYSQQIVDEVSRVYAPIFQAMARILQLPDNSRLAKGISPIGLLALKDTNLVEDKDIVESWKNISDEQIQKVVDIVNKFFPAIVWLMKHVGLIDKKIASSEHQLIRVLWNSGVLNIFAPHFCPSGGDWDAFYVDDDFGAAWWVYLRVCDLQKSFNNNINIWQEVASYTYLHESNRVIEPNDSNVLIWFDAMYYLSRTSDEFIDRVLHSVPIVKMLLSSRVDPRWNEVLYRMIIPNDSKESPNASQYNLEIAKNRTYWQQLECAINKLANDGYVSSNWNQTEPSSGQLRERIAFKMDRGIALTPDEQVYYDCWIKNGNRPAKEVVAETIERANKGVILSDDTSYENDDYLEKPWDEIKNRQFPTRKLTESDLLFIQRVRNQIQSGEARYLRQWMREVSDKPLFTPEWYLDVKRRLASRFNTTIDIVNKKAKAAATILHTCDAQEFYDALDILLDLSELECCYGAKCTTEEDKRDSRETMQAINDIGKCMRNAGTYLWGYAWQHKPYEDKCRYVDKIIENMRIGLNLSETMDYEKMLETISDMVELPMWFLKKQEPTDQDYYDKEADEAWAEKLVDQVLSGEREWVIQSSNFSKVIFW
ncbi:MAG: hypothetical protein LHW48_04650 [Candidatus Cloacimonetes bacterium]|nr:hypothetical protein [Candidatus Cloacimonadota bacterium]